jgi:hypothetical protein
MCCRSTAVRACIRARCAYCPDGSSRVTRGDVLRVELQHAAERLQRRRGARVFQQRPAEEQQRFEIVGILLEQIRQPGDRGPQAAEPALEIGERDPRLVVGRQLVQRALVRLQRVRPFFPLLVQPPQIHPDGDEPVIELQRGAIGGQRAAAIAHLGQDVSLELVEIGACRSPGLGLLQHRERRGGIALHDPHLGDGHEGFHVPRHHRQELFGRGGGLGHPAQRQQRLDLAQPRVGAVAIDVAHFAIALQRFAVQAALGVELGDEGRGVAAVGAALDRPHRLGRGEIEQALADVVAGERELVVGGPRGRGGGFGRRQLLEDVVEQPLIEREVLPQGFGCYVGGDLRHHADRRVFVLQVDRERELLRHVVRIELERPLGGAQRAIEVAEVREREAEVVVRPGVLRVGLHRPRERVARVAEALQLDQHEPHAVPAGGVVRVVGEHLAVRLERELQPAQVEQDEREVQPGGGELGIQLQRGPKRLDRLFGPALVGQRHAGVVPGEAVLRVDLGGAAVRVEPLVDAARLVQDDATLVPELGGVGRFLDQRFVQLERRAEVAPQQVHFRHRLEDEAAVLTALDGEAVLAQRFDVVALLPEREPEVEVRQLAAFDHLHLERLAHEIRLTLALVGGEPIDRQVGLGAGERRVELDGALRRGARFLVPPHVPQHERHQVVRAGVVRVQLHGFLQRDERRVVQPAIVQHFAEVELHDARHGIERLRLLEPVGGDLEAAARFFGEAQLDHGGGVARMVGEDLLELGHRVVELAQRGEGASQLEPRLAVVGRLAQPLLQLRDAAVVVAGAVVGDLEVALGDLHLRVELQRARKLRDRFGDQSLLIVQDAEVVVGPGVSGIDPAAEGSQDREVAIREHGRRHGSGDADRVEDRLEGGEVRQQQKVPAQLFLGIDAEFRLDAEDEVAVVPEIQVRRRQHRGREIDDQARHRGQEQHSHEVGEGVHVGARENVARLF